MRVSERDIMRTEREITTKIDDRNNELDSFLRWLITEAGTGLIERASITRGYHRGVFARFKLRLWGMSETIVYHITMNDINNHTWALLQVIKSLDNHNIDADLEDEVAELLKKPPITPSIEAEAE